MIKEKGFTLIELLAVIVILAVIALIATPIIMKTINDAKSGAAQDSAYGYIKALELAVANKVMDDPNKDYDGDYWITDEGNLKNSSNQITVEYKGNKPVGAVVVKGNNVAAADIQFDEKSFSYYKNEVVQNSDKNVFPYARWNYHGVQGNTTNSVTINWDKLQYNGITGNDAYTRTYEQGKPSQYGIPVKPGEKYRFSWTTTAVSNLSYVFFYTNDNNTGHHTMQNISSSPLEFTIPANTNYLTFRVGVMNGIGTNPTYSNLKLEKVN